LERKIFTAYDSTKIQVFAECTYERLLDECARACQELTLEMKSQCGRISSPSTDSTNNPISPKAN
jgi:hypothetical protein